MEVQPSNHVNWLAFERDTIKFDSDTAFDPNYSYIPLVARGFFGGGGGIGFALSKRVEANLLDQAEAEEIN